MSGKGKSKLTQSSKSTSSKKSRNKRDIISTPPHREFPAATSTFSGLVALLLIVMFSIFLGVNNSYASSISISLSGNVSLNLLKDNANPVFGTSTTATANVTSDHYTGYTLTIAGSNDSGKLENSDGSRYLTSIGESINENTFRTNSDYNDKWGFLPSKYNALDNTNYQPSPTTTETMIDATNSPNPSGTNYTLALGAKVTPSMALDSYGQTFVLAATGNGYDYHIGFTDTMATLPDDIYGNSPQSNKVALPNTRPTKDGYVFAGWCSQPTTNTNTGTTCPSGADVYDPGDEVDLQGDSANNILLYAIWTKGYDTFADAFAAVGASQTSGYYRMQDITPEICDSIVIGSPATTANIAKNTLIDTRNNKTYLVAKYADGHCWMRENLNYVLTANSAIQAYNFETGNTFSYTPNYSTQTATGTAWAQDASDGTRSFQQNKDKYIGGMNIADDGVVKDTGEPYERIGVLYNWAAATAQTGAQAAAAGSSGETEVKTSICPKGWRLPTISGDYSFSTLMGSYSLPTTNQSSQSYSGQLQNPLNFNRLGVYRYSELSVRGRMGAFWSSAVYDIGRARYFGFHNNNFMPQDGDDPGAYKKGTGMTVRCVAV